LSFGELAVRVSVTFLTMFVLARLMGRKEISQMTFFNFVSAIAIGSIAAGVVTNHELPIRSGVTALAGWSLFTIAFEFIDIRLKRSRQVLEGDPFVVIKHGAIVEDTLRRCRIDIDEIRSMLRLNGVFSIADVEYAVYEPNGQLSVLKRKDAPQPARKPEGRGGSPENGAQRSLPEGGRFPLIATDVVSDGKVNQINLAKLGLDRAWLDERLREAGVRAVADVFYAEVLPDGTLYVDGFDQVER